MLLDPGSIYKALRHVLASAMSVLSRERDIGGGGLSCQRTQACGAHRAD